MIWTINKGIKWSFHKGTLYISTTKRGVGHPELHVAFSLPVGGAEFDAVERGRAAAFKSKDGGKTKLTIEVVSLGRNEHLTNGAYKAILKHFALDENEIDIEILEPGWDSDMVTGLQKLERTGD